jgi:hypothetical protein
MMATMPTALTMVAMIFDTISPLTYIKWMVMLIFWGVSDPLCFSSSLALHFFRLFFSCPPHC